MNTFSSSTTKTLMPTHISYNVLTHFCVYRTLYMFWRTTFQLTQSTIWRTSCQILCWEYLSQFWEKQRRLLCYSVSTHYLTINLWLCTKEIRTRVFNYQVIHVGGNITAWQTAPDKLLAIQISLNNTLVSLNYSTLVRISGWYGSLHIVCLVKLLLSTSENG